MKVAIVAQPGDQIVPLVPSGGSLAIVAYNLAKQVVRHCSVVVYAKHGLKDAMDEIDALGIRIRRFAVPFKPWFQLVDRVTGFWNLLPPVFTRAWYYRAYAERVGTHAAAEGVDIIHFFTFPQHISVFRKVHPKAKIVLHMEGEMLSLLDPKTVEPHLEHVDLIIGCSDFITDRIRSRYPRVAERCRTLLNGVDHQRFTPDEGRGVRTQNQDIIYVGRVSPEKGIHVLVDAFKEVLTRFPEAQLHLIGAAGLLPFSFHLGLSNDAIEQTLNGYYGRSLLDKLDRQILHKHTSYVKELKSRLDGQTAAHVHFHGPRPNTELKDWYRKARMLVFPSVWNEPFGMPLTEAMACGMPVVSTRSGGIPEFIEDGVTGLLVGRNDVAELSAAIQRLLADSSLGDRLGRAAQQFVTDHLTWERIGNQLLGYYQDLCNDTAPKASARSNSP